MGAVNRRNISGVLLGFGLLSFTTASLANYGSLLCIALSFTLQLPEIYKALVSRDTGPRVIMIAYAVIIASAGLHFLFNPSKASLAGLSVVTTFPLLYLLARTIGPRLLMMFVIGGLAESVAILAALPGDQNPQHGEIFGIAHFSSLVIALGIAHAPGAMKWPAVLLGVPAILATGSEEGIYILAILCACMCARADYTRRALGAGALISVFLVIIIATGLFTDNHNKLSLSRFDSPGAASNHRTTAYSRVLPDIWSGAGWEWDTAGGVDQTIHNAPLKAAQQFGILAGAAWFGILVWSAVKTRYRYTFIILAAVSMVDHYLFSYLILWPPVIAGALTMGRAGDSDRIFTKTGVLSVLFKIWARLVRAFPRSKPETARYGDSRAN